MSRASIISLLSGEEKGKRLVLSQYEYSKKQRPCLQGDVFIETHNILKLAKS